MPKWPETADLRHSANANIPMETVCPSSVILERKLRCLLTVRPADDGISCLARLPKAVTCELPTFPELSPRWQKRDVTHPRALPQLHLRLSGSWSQGQTCGVARDRRRVRHGRQERHERQRLHVQPRLALTQ